MAGRGEFARFAETSELDHLRRLRQAGRLTLAGDTHQVAPGIEMTRVGGHTPSQAAVSVAAGTGRVLLASDAVHYYEEVERDRPFSSAADVAGMYAGFDRIRAMAQEPGTGVVAGHDPDVLARFPGRAGSPDVVLLG